VFITFEGPEGSGKSSQAKHLVAALRRRGRSVIFVHDPGTTSVGRRLRQLMLHARVHLSPLTEAMLFIAGRIQLVHDVIRPALRRGAVVVCDRFHDSTMAYQGYGGAVPVAWLDGIGRRAINGAMPDVTVVLDLPPEVGLRRVRGARDRMERKQLAFHRRVRRGFLALARREPRRFIVLDGTRPPAELHHAILSEVLRRL
jgi:dTMP kinase